MARENTVLLTGRVTEHHTDYNSKDGVYPWGLFLCECARRSFVNEENFIIGNKRTDEILVHSRNNDLIRNHIRDLEKNDIVFVKGILSSHHVKEKSICPNCNEPKKGTTFHVEPIDIYKIRHADSDEEAKKIIEDHEDAGNHIIVDGTVCYIKELWLPDEEREGTARLEFQIASNRKQRIEEDDDDKRSDYIWVKAFGSDAIDYADLLYIGSEISINGSIQSRTFEETVECPNCGSMYHQIQRTIEIIPYYIVPIKNCNVEEEYEEEDE